MKNPNHYARGMSGVVILAILAVIIFIGEYIY